jgi:hypothetical protein
MGKLVEVGYNVQSANFDLNGLRFQMQRRDVNADAVTQCLNDFDVGKYRIQNFFEEIFSDVDILNVDFARKKFAADVLAAEVFKEHGQILVENGSNELGHSDFGSAYEDYKLLQLDSHSHQLILTHIVRELERETSASIYICPGYIYTHTHTCAVSFASTAAFRSASQEAPVTRCHGGGEGGVGGLVGVDQCMVSSLVMNWRDIGWAGSRKFGISNS